MHRTLSSLACLLLMTLPFLCSAAETSTAIFSSGRGTGPYDKFRYTEYQSEVNLTPTRTMRVRRVFPDLYSCNGSCAYTMEIFDNAGKSLAKFTEREGRVTLIDGSLGKTIVLHEGSVYRLSLRLTSTKSVGLFSAGEAAFPNRSGPATMELIDARSGSQALTERGPISFSLIGTLPDIRTTSERTAVRSERRQARSLPRQHFRASEVRGAHVLPRKWSLTPSHTIGNK